MIKADDEKPRGSRHLVREFLNKWWRSEAAKQADLAIRARSIRATRPTVDEFGDTVWPDTDWLYVEDK